jgi:hypothetical protein
MTAQRDDAARMARLEQLLQECRMALRVIHRLRLKADGEQAGAALVLAAIIARKHMEKIEAEVPLKTEE